MADMEQMKQQVDALRMKKSKVQEQIDKHTEAIAKLTKERDKYQEDIDNITGVQEEADAAVTTSNAGDISTLGGSGNYAPKIGMVLKRKKKKKKKKNENKAIDYLDNLLS